MSLQFKYLVLNVSFSGWWFFTNPFEKYAQVKLEIIGPKVWGEWKIPTMNERTVSPIKDFVIFPLVVLVFKGELSVLAKELDVRKCIKWQVLIWSIPKPELVGGFNPSEISQNWNLPQLGVKIKKCLKPPPSERFGHVDSGIPLLQSPPFGLNFAKVFSICLSGWSGCYITIGSLAISPS